MQWWCAAQGAAWTGEWQAYPGVWLFVAALAWLCWSAYRRAELEERRPVRRAAMIGGLLAIWLALDWPIGALGAGYLVWVHSGQFMLLAMVAPPLLLYGLPRSTLGALVAPGSWRGFLGQVVQPLPAVVTFNVGVILTHIPRFVDVLMVSQVGSLVLDLAWLAIGVVFWWPILGPVPGRPPVAAPVKIGVLLVSMFVHMAVGMVLVIVPYPLYRVYELAPPVGMLRIDDQQLAGGVMLYGSSAIVLTALLLLMRRWHMAEAARTHSQ